MLSCMFIKGITLLLGSFLFTIVSSSNGDLSSHYRTCLRACKQDECDGNDTSAQPWLLGWSCEDECRYNCMWDTVDRHKQLNSPIALKFHGKWPFYRFLGIQEPASALFSILNLLAHFHMYKKLSKKLTEFRDPPFKTTWKIFSMVCIHAWTWSTLFHTRDTPFTEFMDYACALSMVMAFYASAVVRILHGFRHPYSALVALVPALLYYADHIRCLWTSGVDYGHNVALNVTLGVIVGVLWLLFAIRQWWAGFSYVWRVALFTLLTGACLTLELFDFPPLLGVLDAHALWHLCTAPLPYLYYRFLIDDVDYIAYATKKIKSV